VSGYEKTGIFLLCKPLKKIIHVVISCAISIPKRIISREHPFFRHYWLTNEQAGWSGTIKEACTDDAKLLSSLAKIYTTSAITCPYQALWRISTGGLRARNRTNHKNDKT